MALVSNLRYKRTVKRVSAEGAAECRTVLRRNGAVIIFSAKVLGPGGILFSSVCAVKEPPYYPPALDPRYPF